MEIKTVQFNAGNLVVDERNITLQSQNGLNKSQSIERIYIGNVNYEEYVYLRLSPFSYGLRFFLIGCVLGILGVVFHQSTDILFVVYWFGILLALFGAFIIFTDSVIDALLGSRISKNICSMIFGIEGYKINITNKIGDGGIEFLINTDELETAKGLIQFKLQENKSNISLSDSIKELNKLMELKNKGAITDMEFNNLKEQLLRNNIQK